MSSDVFDNDLVLRPPILLPKMLEAATMRAPRKRWPDGRAGSFDNSPQKDSCSFRSTASSASSPSAVRSSLPQSPPCKTLRFSSIRCDATLTAASKSMDAWVRERQRPHSQHQHPQSALGLASPSPSWATAAGSGAASPSTSWVTAAGSGPGSPIVRAKEGGSPVSLAQGPGSPVVLAQEEYEDMVLMGTDDEGEGECLGPSSVGPLAFEDRSLVSGRSAEQGKGLRFEEDRSGESTGVPVRAVVLPDADEGTRTDGEASKGSVGQLKGFEVCGGTRRMQKVCSTVSERREEEEELAEDTETEMSGQEEGEHHQHRRFLSGQSCSTGYSSADGGADSIPETNRHTNAHGNTMSIVAHINTSDTRNPSSACSDPTKVPIPSQLSTFPPGTESCPSGVSGSPTHSRESSSCPLSPEHRASLPTSQPTSATAPAATVLAADAASAAAADEALAAAAHAADAALAAAALAADAVKQCGLYVAKPLPAAALDTANKEEDGSNQQQQQQQGHGEEGATDALISVCRVCRKLRLAGCPAEVKEWLRLQGQLHPSTQSSSAGLEHTHVATSIESVHRALALWEGRIARAQQGAANPAASAECAPPPASSAAQPGATNTAAAECTFPATAPAHSLSTGSGSAMVVARLCTCADATSAVPLADTVLTRLPRNPDTIAAESAQLLSPTEVGQNGVRDGGHGMGDCASHAVLDTQEAEVSDAEEGEGGEARALARGGEMEGGHGAVQEGEGEEEEHEEDHEAGSEDGAECSEASLGRDGAEGEHGQQAEAEVRGRRQAERERRRRGRGFGKFLGAVGGGSRSNSPWAVVLALAVLPWRVQQM